MSDRDHERLVRMHRRLDPPGTSERSTEELLERVLVENELLRTTFVETQVIFEDSRIDFVDVRAPRSVWLRLRSWRAADREHGRPASRWDRFTYEELTAIFEVIDHSRAGDVPARSREAVMTILDQLRAVRRERSYEAAT